MKQAVRFIGNVLYGFVIAVLAFVALGVMLSTSAIPVPFRLFTVQSGSMEPTIPVGSLVLVQKDVVYKPGDIVSFSPGAATGALTPKDTTTHRIHDVATMSATSISFITKGDANNAPDTNPVSNDRIIGKVVLSLPYIGFAIAFARSQIGFVLLIIIPATLIIYSEFQVIIREIKKRRVKKP